MLDVFLSACLEYTFSRVIWYNNGEVFMKKLFLLLILLLVACQEEASEEILIEEPIEIVEIVEEVEYIEENDLKGFIYEVNDQLRIIDLDALHTRIEAILVEKIDFTVSIDEQIEIIEDIVLDELEIWRREVVRDVIEQSGDLVNDDDYETIVSRSSIRAAYKVMVSYEKAYIKNRGRNE